MSVINSYLLQPFPYNIYAEAIGDSDFSQKTAFMERWESSIQLRQTFWYVIFGCVTSKVGTEHKYDAADIMVMRYRDGMNLEEIGNILGVTKERIRQLIVKTFSRLRRGNGIELIEQGLQNYYEQRINEESVAAEARGKESVFRELRLLLADKDCTPEKIQRYVQTASENSNPYISMTLDEFNDEFHFSIRVYNAVSRKFGNNPIPERSQEEIIKLGIAGQQGKNNRLVTVRDIVNMTEEEARNIRNLGEKGYSELKEKLMKAGLSFRKDD